jgi:tRNA-splicing endonuclease subunit Sen34
MSEEAVIAIHAVGRKGLIFDIEDLKILREKYHICGTLTGIVPQVPQQNVFMGLPLELMAEDVDYLLEEGVGYLVNDSELHSNIMSSFTESDRKEVLRQRSESEQKQIETYKEDTWKRRQQALEQKGLKKDEGTKEEVLKSLSMSNFAGINYETPTTSNESASYKLFESQYHSQSDLSLQLIDRPSPASYNMYKYLHSQNYFLSPGLRFGGQFLAYPGDPLRFHSHYIAIGYEWDEQFKILDIVGGGRLGTAVKKCWVVGAQNRRMETNKVDQVNQNEVKAFEVYCIEWAGFG